MVELLDALEVRLAELRPEIRAAIRAGDVAAVTRLRSELREATDAWERLVTNEAPQPVRTPTGASPVRNLPVREQVHQILTILGAPAGPKLISAAHAAFLSGPVSATRLGTMRRDEERSFAAQPNTRPYYLCPALTHDRFTPVRGLLAVSTWPLEQRIMGPLSSHTDFLTHTIRIAEQVARIREAGHEPTSAAWQLLENHARNIPGAHQSFGQPDTDRVIKAATAEAAAHAQTDSAARRDAAAHARTELTDPVRLLFGTTQTA